ncbi:MAG: DegV family protein [Oscillospiraceae bacterium]
MERKPVLFADSTADLTEDLYKEFDIHNCYYHIISQGKDYRDNVDITTEQIFDVYYKTKELPKTSCINEEDYYAEFKPYLDQGYDIVCVTLGSGISTSYSNLKRLAEKHPDRIYPVDSGNLSTATGLVTIEAAKAIKAGASAKEAQEAALKVVPHTHASFVLDTLEFLKAGGRCSALQAFGANLFSLKVEIEVSNKDATMTVGKKYRGGISKVMPQYIRDQLTMYKKVRTDRIMFTHSGLPQELIDLGVNTIKEIAHPDIINITRSNCTISSHCGPNCYGVLFITED